ncbi:hypothetical protein pkur_cds_724 [Pandoravirus kuranda]|uniref:F-box incomplete domain containing protein n=1 Tax=Pandoravirus kuranda TaxID=3019033 RepID=A0AA95EHC0_9VIRU|nr:hypothetical protein pkur_cds_724 [Pandoravirus kuranda]
MDNDDDTLAQLCLSGDAKSRRSHTDAPRSPLEGCAAQDETHAERVFVHELPIEIVTHVLNGIDSSGRPLFDPLWRFAARATCRLWRGIIGMPTTAQARAIVRAWRHGRADSTRRVQCLCLPCTHDGGGGLKHLIATGRLVTATCAVALGARRDRHGRDDSPFDAHCWCASPIPDQDVALCVAMMATTREAVDRIVRQRLAPLFVCDAGGRCPTRAIERADVVEYDYVKGLGVRVQFHDQTDYDDGRRLVIDLLAVAARQGRVTLLASLAALSERVRALARGAVAALVYYACMADRCDVVAWVLRGILDTSAADHPLSPLGVPLSDDPIAYRARACSDAWKAIAQYDAVGAAAAVLEALDHNVRTHADLCDIKWAPHKMPWQRRAAHCGATGVLQTCQRYGVDLDLDAILTEAAKYGRGTTVRWVLTREPVAKSTDRVGLCWEALSLVAAEGARDHDARGADLAIDSLCRVLRGTYVSRTEAAESIVTWWRAADWDRWGKRTRDCASAARVALHWRDLLVDNLDPDDVVDFLRLAIVRLNYKALDSVVSLFAGRRALVGIDLWAMALDVLYTNGTAMQPYRGQRKPDPYGSPPVPWDRPLSSTDTRPTLFVNDLFYRNDQERAAEMIMFLASVCAHRAQVGSATRAQWRSVCRVATVAPSSLPSTDMGHLTVITLPAWLHARGLFARPS